MHLEGTIAVDIHRLKFKILFVQLFHWKCEVEEARSTFVPEFAKWFVNAKGGGSVPSDDSMPMI